MKQPRNLEGEVKKFEDLLYYYEQYDIMGADSNIHDFYTQPFKDEMVNKYFDYNEMVSILHNKQLKYHQFSVLLKQGYSIRIADEALKTLSDFIDACLNSDIKLTWKST